ncbi:MAG TPA: FAD-dependent monooxygenase [Roseiarcus sp.]|nr:FAD-dependent monooxygenase [Roseiarcus sp.]
MKPRALIAGAGIGGLAAAIALARAGYEAAVFERADVLEEIGAGIQVTPNASRALGHLGALEAVEQSALAPSAIRIFRGRDGAELSRLPLDAQRRWGAPYLVLQRAALQRALVETAAREPSISLTLGVEVGGFSDDGSGVTLGLKRGLLRLAERGDLLIGADGLRSIVRERLGLGKHDEPRFSNRVAFRATIDAGAAPIRARERDVSLHLGPKAHLVHYPVAGGALVNIVAVIESDWRAAAGDQPWDGEADRAALARAFARWSREARALIEAAQNWRAWPLHNRPPISAMARGRVALLGDAAHPMLPFLAQGAAQAIEDADILAECLSATSDVADGLAAYSRHRAPRAARMQKASEDQTQLYHVSGLPAAARDIGMRAMGPERLLRRYDWIYGG